MGIGIERAGHAKPEWLTELSHDPLDGETVHRVAELLPPGYEAYLRLFHPFRIWGSDADSTDGSSRRTWKALADEAGASFGGELTWRSLQPALPLTEGRRPYEVDEGHLDRVTRRELFSTLDAHTSPGSVYFFYGLAAVVAGHDSVLFRAPAGAVEEVVAAARSEGLGESPELAWPEERAWLLCSDYDVTSTYIASDRALADALIDDTQLEIAEVSRDARIDGRADEFTDGLGAG